MFKFFKVASPFIVSKRSFYQVQMEKAGKASIERPATLCFLVGIMVSTLIAWLSPSDICVLGHDLAVQPAKLHLHPC